MANELSELDAALASGMESAGNEPAPALDFSSLYGDADYEGRERAEPVAAPAARAAAPDEELRALRARVDGHDAIVAQARAEAEQRQHQWQRSQEEAGVYQAAMQEAARLATVADVNPDDILGDPVKFRAHNQGLVNQAVRAAITAMRPAQAELQEVKMHSQQSLRSSQSQALERASERMSELGLGELDADERASVVQYLQKMGKSGEAMLADPQQVVNAALLARAERGQVLPTRQQRAPTAAPTNGTRRNNSGRVPMTRLPRAAQDVFRRLRIPIEGDFTQDELETLRAAGI